MEDGKEDDTSSDSVAPLASSGQTMSLREGGRSGREP
jgi:hypothetical protein